MDVFWSAVIDCTKDMEMRICEILSECCLPPHHKPTPTFEPMIVCSDCDYAFLGPIATRAGGAGRHQAFARWHFQRFRLRQVLGHRGAGRWFFSVWSRLGLLGTTNILQLLCKCSFVGLVLRAGGGVLKMLCSHWQSPETRKWMNRM